MKSSWDRFVTIYLDPSIKVIDRDIYSLIDSQIRSSGYSIGDPGAILRKSSFFDIKIIPQNKNTRSFDFDTDIVIVFEGANMSLFSPVSPQQGELSFFDEKDFQETLQLVKYLIRQRIENYEKEIFYNSSLLLTKNAGAKKIKASPLAKSEIKLLDQIETQIYHELSFEGIQHILNDYLVRLGRNYKLCDASYIFNKKIENYLPLGKNEKVFFAIQEESIEMFDLYVFNIVQEASRRFQVKETGRVVLIELEEIFSKLEIPIAVFDKSQHLVLHNIHFINLNISAKEACSLKINDQITLGNEVYNIQKVFIQNGKYTHINFIPVRDFLSKSGTPSSEELGIVSSSIAHELNNPLAGILAALNVLELDEVPVQIEKKYAQMRESVMRCKKLVETFLGFSRIKQGEFTQRVQLKDCFDQAMDLIRFRLIESNVNFGSDYFVEADYQGKANPYVLSMLFYLFFGEILTNFSHQKLVTEKQSLKVSMKFFEKKNSFGIDLGEGVTIGDSFVSSKLIQHLLATQNLTLKHEGKKLTFF